LNNTQSYITGITQSNMNIVLNNGEYQLPTLYNTNRVWTIYIKSSICLRTKETEFIDNKNNNFKVYIYTIYGVENGKMITSAPTDINGKNKGRKNETTNLRQAIMQAESMFNKKKQSGYKENNETSLSLSIDKLYYPMALDLYSKHMKKLSYPLMIQPKLDGVRTLMVNKNGIISLFSRRLHAVQGFDIVKTQCEELIKHCDLLNDIIFLDGEFYVHGKPLQDISGIVRKEIKEDKYKEVITQSKDELEYHIFDICVKKDNGFIERIELLKEMFTKLSEVFIGELKIKLVNTTLVNNETEGDRLFTEYVENGYEGVVYKSNTKYEYSEDKEKRSSLYLKRKKQMDAEFEIVDFCEGKGKFKGMVIFTLKTIENNEFNCVPMGSAEYRKQLYLECLESFDKFKGRYAKVKFDDYSKNMTPVRGVIVQIDRDLTFD